MFASGEGDVAVLRWRRAGDAEVRRSAFALTWGEPTLTVGDSGRHGYSLLSTCLAKGRIFQGHSLSVFGVCFK